MSQGHPCPIAHWSTFKLPPKAARSQALQEGNGKTFEREVYLHAKLGTGLSRPDVYNWFDVTQELIEEYKPDMVIAQFVGNDCQTLVTPDGVKL